MNQSLSSSSISSLYELQHQSLLTNESNYTTNKIEGDISFDFSSIEGAEFNLFASEDSPEEVCFELFNNNYNADNNINHNNITTNVIALNENYNGIFEENNIPSSPSSSILSSFPSTPIQFENQSSPLSSGDEMGSSIFFQNDEESSSVEFKGYHQHPNSYPQFSQQFEPFVNEDGSQFYVRFKAFQLNSSPGKLEQLEIVTIKPNSPFKFPNEISSEFIETLGGVISKEPNEHYFQHCYLDQQSDKITVMKTTIGGVLFLIQSYEQLPNYFTILYSVAFNRESKQTIDFQNKLNNMEKSNDKKNSCPNRKRNATKFATFSEAVKLKFPSNQNGEKKLRYLTIALAQYLDSDRCSWFKEENTLNDGKRRNENIEDDLISKERRLR
eukprot:TRINITY_DN3525_c0_g1_i2.p1 TRINITY_DN3525_c0_g1~~TRINITY_DN3525_c0_g1_i2.p1  ORF type:complete len:392 (-),score=144.29 TRINITY_DN3525_c0_g1_i2:41-1195(-)